MPLFCFHNDYISEREKNKTRKGQQIMKLHYFTAEMGVLGAVLIDGTLFEKLDVQEKHFQRQVHREVFQAMKETREAGEEIDVLTVAEYLVDSCPEVNGPSYLYELVEMGKDVVNIKAYERVILANYQNRGTEDILDQLFSKRGIVIIEPVGFTDKGKY